MKEVIGHKRLKLVRMAFSLRNGVTGVVCWFYFSSASAIWARTVEIFYTLALAADKYNQLIKFSSVSSASLSPLRVF